MSQAEVHEFDDRTPPEDSGVESPGPFAAEVVEVKRLAKEARDAAVKSADAALKVASQVATLVKSVDTVSERLTKVEDAVKNQRASIGELSEEQGQALARDAAIHAELKKAETGMQKMARLTKPATTIPVAVATAVVEVVVKHWPTISGWLSP